MRIVGAVIFASTIMGTHYFLPSNGILKRRRIGVAGMFSPFLTDDIEPDFCPAIVLFMDIKL